MPSMKCFRLTVSLGLVFWTSCTYAEANLEARIRRVAHSYAARYAGVFCVPVELVEAVIEVESSWKPLAVSTQGACGLMQLMPSTAQRFEVKNPFNIEQNIRAGVEYLDVLKRLFKGDLRLVLGAYAAGEGRILRRGLGYSNRDVVDYVEKVARLYRKKTKKRSLQGENNGSVATNTCAAHDHNSDNRGGL